MSSPCTVIMYLGSLRSNWVDNMFRFYFSGNDRVSKMSICQAIIMFFNLLRQSYTGQERGMCLAVYQPGSTRREGADI